MAELQRQKYEIPGIDYNLMDEHTKARVREALDREWERKQAAEAFAREAEAMYQAGMERRQSIMDNPKHFPAFKEHYEQEVQHYISLIENLLPKDSDAYKWYYGYAYLIANSQDELSGMYNERRVNELLAMVEGKAAMALGSMIPSRPSTPIPEPKLPNFNFKGTGNAFDVAKNGGKHSGFYNQYVNKSKEEIQKGIQSLDKQIAEHQSKIRNPEAHIPNFKDLDPRQQEALINKKWPSDIQRQKEQKEILEGILRSR